MKILLDNGHGTDTPGKRSPVWSDGSQLFEYQFNRDVVLRIVDLFGGKDVYVIAPELYDVPLSERVRRVNSIWATYPDVVLVSVHGNAGPRPNVGTGWEAWTSHGQTRSDRLAELLYIHAGKKLQPFGFPIRKDLTDGDQDKESGFAMIKKTYCAAVLTENLFFDNEKDCRFMMSDEGKDVIANIHFDALTQFLEEEKNVGRA